MPDLIDGSENVTVHGIFNWILLLAIFSAITAIGNYLGYKHPMTDSLVGMGKSWNEFKALGWRAIVITVLVIASTYYGAAIVAHIVLVLTGVPIA